jgi:hypothetical protein
MWLHFDDQGWLRAADNHCCVYALFALETANIAHVKIGMASDVWRRAAELRTGIPFPVEVVLWAPAGSRKRAGTVEKLIHRGLDERREAGEWFRFDMTSAADKTLFHTLTKAVYIDVTGKPLAWNKITPEQLRDYVAYRNERAKDRAAKRKRKVSRWY